MPRAGGPAHPQPGPGECLGHAVDEHGVVSYVGADPKRMFECRTREGQHPVHLVEHDIKRLQVITAPPVDVHHQLADLLHILCRQHGTRRILRRAERQQRGVLEMRFQHGRRGHEVIVRLGFHRLDPGAAHLGIVFIVPGRYRVDDLVMGVDDGAVGRVDHRSGAAGDEYIIGSIVEAAGPVQQVRHALANPGEAHRAGIVGLMIVVGLDGGLGQRFRHGKDPRIEIPDGQVV